MESKKEFILMAALAIILMQSCGHAQSNKSDNQMKITKEQYNSISKNVQTYDYNPTYQVRFNAAYCTYEIFVNDMLATFSFGTGNTAGEQNVDIPQFILRSGPQRLKIKIYPKAIERGQLEQTIPKNAVFSARVVFGEYYKEKPDSFKEVIKLTPEFEDNSPYFELDTVFNATVPYILEGWSKGVDLSKEDSQKLEQEALGVYKKYNEAFEEKDISSIATTIYNREKEIAQSFFYVSGKEGSYDNGWEDLEQKAKDLKELLPIENYEMRYFGNSKVVALLKKEPKYRDFPVVYGRTYNQKLRFYGLFLYRPAPGAPLEVIR